MLSSHGKKSEDQNIDNIKMKFPHWSTMEKQSVKWSRVNIIRHGRHGGIFKNAHKLLNLRALKISTWYKNCIIQCVGKIFCVEFQWCSLKFHTKYLTHALKDFIHRITEKFSCKYPCQLITIFKTGSWLTGSFAASQSGTRLENTC